MPKGVQPEHKTRTAAPRQKLRRSLKRLQLLLALFPACLLSLPAAAQQPLEAACLKLGGDESLGPQAFEAFERLFQALYARAGLCQTSIAMDPKRIEQLLDLGELDGDWFRPEDYVAVRHKHVIQLPQPVMGLEARLIWLAGSGFSGKPADLRGLTVGYHAGFRWLETHLPTVGARPFAVTSTAQIRGLLERGRIDVFATSSAHEPLVLDAFRDDPARVKDAIWQAVPFYHLLAPKHADKVARLNAALLAMIRSGELQAFLTMPGVIVLPPAPNGAAAD